MECLFCRIVSGEVPATTVYRDDLVVVFNDINPQAPEHKLIIPQKHISTLNDVAAEDKELLGHMLHVAKMLAKEIGIADAGYRVVMNCNAGAGQTVFHVHAHLLGGRGFSWPPG